MITPFQIYLITLLDNMHKVAGIIFGLSIIACGACFLYVLMESPDENTFLSKEGKEKKRLWLNPKIKIIKKIVVCGLISLSICFFVPSAKTCVAMYVVPKVVNNESLQKLPDSILKYINNYITEEKKQWSIKQKAILCLGT